MKNIKKYLLYGIFGILAICIVCGIFIYTKNIKMAEGTDSFDMYYINPSTHTLQVEKRVINSVSDQKLMFNSVVEEFFSGSKNANLSLILPQDFKVIDKRYQNTTAFINLSETYDELSPDMKILSMGALVYTLTDLSFIDGISVSIEGTPLLDKTTGSPVVLTRDIVLNNPTINPEKTNWQVVSLYFATQDGEHLVSQQRGIEVKQSQSLEYQIVEQLITGPDTTEGEKLLSTVPTDTKIRDIKTEEGICYVNLSRDFMKTNGKISEPIIIYSVVNSLTELADVNKVQFLIEGEKINEYNGDMDFSKPFDRNTKLIN